MVGGRGLRLDPPSLLLGTWSGTVTVFFTLYSGLRPWPLHAGIYGVVVNLVLLIVVSRMTAGSLKSQDAEYLDAADTPS